MSVPRAKLALYTQWYDVVAPKIFNKFPYHLKTERSLSIFLRGLKEWLFTMDLDLVESIVFDTLYTI